MRNVPRDSIVGWIAVLAVTGALGYWVWGTLTTPPRPKPVQALPSDRSGPGYFAVAGAAVDLEIVAPDGRRATTAAHSDTAGRIPGSHGSVECAGFGVMRESQAACAASLTVWNPVHGAYRVVVFATDSARAETLNLGYGGATFRRSGGFSVRVSVAPGQPVEFGVTVNRDGVSQRSRVVPSTR